MAWTSPRTWVAGETLTAALLNTHLRDNLNAGFPVGSFHFLLQAATSTVTDVNGMGLEGNGSAPSRATYSALNTLHSGLSYPFGSGDGSTTFNLIDLRGRGLIAHPTSSGHADVKTLGTTDGSALANRSPKHNHTVVSASAGTPSGSVSGVTFVQSGGSGFTLGTGGNVFSNVTTTPAFTGSPLGSHTHTVGVTGRTADTAAFAVGGIWWIKY